MLTNVFSYLTALASSIHDFLLVEEIKEAAEFVYIDIVKTWLQSLFLLH